jgi:hypothetical protein
MVAIGMAACAVVLIVMLTMAVRWARLPADSGQPEDSP